MLTNANKNILKTHLHHYPLHYQNKALCHRLVWNQVLENLVCLGESI